MFRYGLKVCHDLITLSRLLYYGEPLSVATLFWEV